MNPGPPPDPILVTGSRGFIGRFVCQAYVERGQKVIGLNRNCGDSGSEYSLSCDITRPLDPGSFAGVRTILHLAGKAHAVDETYRDRVDYFAVNKQGTHNVLRAAQASGVRRFVLVSSVKAMTRNNGTVPLDEQGEPRPWRETDAILPDTPYGQSKLEAEELVLGGGYVREPVVLRLCLVYGPGVKGNLQRMIEAVARNRFPPVPENENRRSMVHVRDVVKAAMLAADHPRAVGETFIVSDGQHYSTREMYELIRRALGKKIPRWEIPTWFLRRAADAGDLITRLRGRRCAFDSDALEKLLGSAWFSSEKIASVLGYRPKWSLQEALPEMVQEFASPAADSTC